MYQKKVTRSLPVIRAPPLGQMTERAYRSLYKNTCIRLKKLSPLWLLSEASLAINYLSEYNVETIRDHIQNPT